MKPVVIEAHEGIDVAREDLFDPRLPSGKLRGLMPWFAYLKDMAFDCVVNYAVSYSNSHAIVAFCGAQAGLKVITLANCDKPNPHLSLAASYGADVVYAGAGHLSPLKRKAEDYVKENTILLPWGLAHPQALFYIATAVAAIPDEYDMHVVPMGAGGYTYAVAMGMQMRYPDQKVRVTAVPVSGSYQTNLKRLSGIGPALPIQILENHDFVQSPPFPHDDHYESRAWPIAKDLRDDGLKVLFWNIGVPLC